MAQASIGRTGSPRLFGRRVFGTRGFAPSGPARPGNVGRILAGALCGGLCAGLLVGVVGGPELKSAPARPWLESIPGYHRPDPSAPAQPDVGQASTWGDNLWSMSPVTYSYSASPAVSASGRAPVYSRDTVDADLAADRETRLALADRPLDPSPVRHAVEDEPAPQLASVRADGQTEVRTETEVTPVDPDPALGSDETATAN